MSPAPRTRQAGVAEFAGVSAADANNIPLIAESIEAARVAQLVEKDEQLWIVKRLPEAEITQMSLSDDCADALSPDGWTSYSTNISAGSRDLSKITVWRAECSEHPDDVFTFLRVEPLEGATLVCSSAFEVKHAGDVYNAVGVIDNNGGAFCSSVSKPETFTLELWMREKSDQLDAYTLVYEGAYCEYPLEIPAYTKLEQPAPEQPASSENRRFGKELSGSWYDPTRDGEGFNFEFSSSGLFIAYMYTYQNTGATRCG